MKYINVSHVYTLSISEYMLSLVSLIIKVTRYIYPYRTFTLFEVQFPLMSYNK